MRLGLRARYRRAPPSGRPMTQKLIRSANSLCRGATRLFVGRLRGKHGRRSAPCAPVNRMPYDLAWGPSTAQDGANPLTCSNGSTGKFPEHRSVPTAAPGRTGKASRHIEVPRLD